jgi:hypothetical protein
MIDTNGPYRGRFSTQATTNVSHGLPETAEHVGKTVPRTHGLIIIVRRCALGSSLLAWEARAGGATELDNKRRWARALTSISVCASSLV